MGRRDARNWNVITPANIAAGYVNLSISQAPHIALAYLSDARGFVQLFSRLVLQQSPVQTFRFCNFEQTQFLQQVCNS